MSIFETIKELDCIITVATDASNSEAIDLGGRTLVAIYTPSALTGSNLSFKTNKTKSESIANYVPVMTEAGAVYSVPITTNDYVTLDVNKFLGVRHLRIVSDGTEASNRTFTLVTRLI